jgi:hypothetical protein
LGLAAFGTAATLLLLGLIVLVLGPLLDRVPLHLLQLVDRHAAASLRHRLAQEGRAAGGGGHPAARRRGEPPFETGETVQVAWSREAALILGTD